MVRSVVNKVMWVENPEVLTLDVAAMLAAALVASMLILIVVMRPAEAAFPGVNSNNGLTAPSLCDVEVVRNVYELQRRVESNPKIEKGSEKGVSRENR